MWHQRWHPLREEWIIVAAHRQNRPWSGGTLGQDDEPLPDYDPQCYLCPGNTRVAEARNPTYSSVHVFDNDHPCVGPDAPEDLPDLPEPYRSRPARGFARVVCYSPKHNLTLAELPVSDIDGLFSVWQDQMEDLGSRPEIDHVLIFENKGEVVGVSNPHPHCQIYATNFIFKTIETEAAASRKYFDETGRVLFQEILQAEKSDGRRIIYENDSAVAFIPYFGRYAYEVFIAPKETHPTLAELSKEERLDLARALKSVTVRFDNLWETSFPYVMPLHQAPTDGKDHSAFHFHIEFHPPLRKPNLLKYLAGPEIGGGNFLSDTLPEEKAAELRDLSDIHYKTRRDQNG